MLWLRFIFLHFGHDISYNRTVKVLGNPKKLWPAQEMVEVVLHLHTGNKPHQRDDIDNTKSDKHQV